MTATNGIGWVVEEFSLPEGWKQSIMFPEVYSTEEEARKVLQAISLPHWYAHRGGKAELRVYEALS